jgi:two-component system, chemotaxis family, chemotaxis protein CheY
VSPQVLLVDDAATVRRYITQVMESAGFHVSTAEDGQRALVVLRSRPQLDLVMLDFNMPGMNGLSVLQWMRSEEATRDLPVVMLTTETAPSLVKRAKELGAAGWVVKPPKAEQLIQVARNAIATRRSSGD